MARTLAVVENVRPTTSGKPTIAGPPRAIRETSPIAVIAFTPPALLRPLAVILVPASSGAKLLRIQTGNFVRHHGAQRLRMQDFGSKVCKFGGFAIRDFWNRTCFGNQARVSRQNSVHVCPDDRFIGQKCGAENRRGIVGTAPAKRGKRAFLTGSNKPCDNRNITFLKQRTQARFTPLSGGIHERLRASIKAISNDQFRGLNRLAGSSESRDHRRNNGRRKTLAQTRNHVEAARSELAKKGRAFAEPLGVTQKLIDPRQKLRSRFCVESQFAERRFMQPADRFENLLRLGAFTRFCERGSFYQSVRDAAHRRHNYKHGVLARRRYCNLCRSGDTRSIANRSAAKFHDHEL